MSSFILFPNSVHILITNALTSLSDKLFVSLFFPPGFSLVLSTENGSAFSFFFLTFSASMNLGEAVT